MTQTNPKPCEMWAVYDSKGNFVAWSVGRTQQTAIRNFIEQIWGGAPNSHWDKYLSIGYSIHRVTVTPIVEAQP